MDNPESVLETPSTPAAQAGGIGRKGISNILTVMAGTLGSRGLGLVRQLAFNRLEGTLTDAFTIAFRIPNLLRELLAEGALINSFIPVYKSLPDLEQKKLASSFTAVLLAVNFIVLGLGILLAPWLVQSVLYPGGNPQVQATAIVLTQWMMPFLTFISLSTVAMGLLNAGEHFRASAFAPMAFNVVSIFVLLAFPHSAFWLAMSTTLGGLAQLAVQIPSLRRLGLMPNLQTFWHPALRRVLLLMIPFTISTSGKQFLNFFVVRFFTGFPKNALTGYSNAEVLFQLALGLFAVSPALALYPRLATHSTAKDWDAFRRLTLQALRLTSFIAAPVSILFSVLAPYAVSLVKFSSTLEAERLSYGALTLSTWALAIVPSGLNALLVRTFFVRERTIAPLIVTSLGAVADVALYGLLVPHYGLQGFGLATTITSTITASLLMAMYSIGVGMNWSPLIRHLGRVIPMALVAGAVAYAVSRVLPGPGNLWRGMLGLTVAGGAGMAVYLALAMLFRVPEVSSLRSRLTRSK